MGTIVLDSLSAVAAALQSGELLEGLVVERTEATWIEVSRGRATALVVSPPMWSDGTQVTRALDTLGARPVAILCLGAPAELINLPVLGKRATVACVQLPTTTHILSETLDSGLRMEAELDSARERGQLAERSRFELRELIAIANAINSEHDLNRLLRLILEKSRYVTGADAGSIYVLDPKDRTLRFEVAQNESIDLDLESFTMEISERSIVGAAVIRQEIINIPDLYQLAHHNPWGVAHDRSFDERTGYQSRSLLTVPLINHQDHVIGVLQLINKKTTPGRALRSAEDFKNSVVPFDPHSVKLCKTLASQAGISLENGLLYNELQSVFEGFVNASVRAIEARDPTTSGHSERVAALTQALAEAVSQTSEGAYRDVTFTEEELRAIKYAGLLHDFGKISVPEAVLLKGLKMYPWEHDIVMGRFDYIRQWMRSRCLAKKLERCKEGGPGIDLAALDDVLAKEEEYLDLCVTTLDEANQPSVLDSESSRMLQEIARQRYVDPGGDSRPFLSEEELACLSISRGNLNEDERQKIQSHVVHTSNYLNSIPWGAQYFQIPEIARSHHEKLDGTGYPDQKIERQIPIPARMMAIADVYDALTASDRPYKKAVPHDRALKILKDEVSAGKLDAEVFRLFLKNKIHLRVKQA